MKREAGFTLLELLVTITILGIVLSVGVPSFRGIVMDNRLATQANLFATSIKLARSNAVKFQREATVCSSKDYYKEKPDCDDVEDWSAGWIVWVNKDREHNDPDENEVIAVFGPVHESITFVSEEADRFTFDSRGFASPDTPAGELTLCDSRSGEMGRVIRVNATGRTNISRQVCP